MGRRQAHAASGIGSKSASNKAPDAFARLLAGAVGEPYDREAGDAVTDVGLHVHAARLESDESTRDRACKHVSRLGAKH
jgi:hypothetical protein